MNIKSNEGMRRIILQLLLTSNDRLKEDQTWILRFENKNWISEKENV